MNYLWIQSIQAREELVLPPEAHQHVRALRLRLNDPLVLFDGLGNQCAAQIAYHDRKQTKLNVDPSSYIFKKPLHGLRLVLGVPKFSTLEFIIQKATELGVSAIVLLPMEHTPVAINQSVWEKKKVRWEKIMIAACEQSQQVHIPKLLFQTVDDYLKEDVVRYVFTQHAEKRVGQLLAPCDVIVGPEGGFSDFELSNFGQQFKLCEGTLRTDTAAIAAVLAFNIGC
ncbi:16S rRNA (uracil(1498)-N(3))-methyltransferase [Candidatus Comchoanobacter bicostacola]|uniref:Ribosomal RNA small subunit methyltransferase E n=1 Tax=Candidatus Comchoanobacter bicostacola TaxID=2919598 RepID=A0ABY5DLG6_9GAMM|nr:RsmE family RNA methyltransferase [Candidatus Comchoanobacter bicostacola]UTC24625.1 16S rRNA (uracil(1498)-N(3))-methyltransferase [Candidatus Comchoanobacter bicostacola]